MCLLLFRAVKVGDLVFVSGTSFADGNPARTTTEARLAREELRVEIECVAQARKGRR